MKLILARHGNTFNAHEPAFYVGSQHDLPLVAYGIEQAKAIGHALLQQDVNLTAVYTGPLLRMRTTAQEAMRVMQNGLQEIVDERLNELDYGLWSGLTSQEVRQEFGDEDYERWEQQSIWSRQGKWGESEQVVVNRINDFTNNLVKHHAENDTVLVVASNGCLRYFLKLIAGAFEEKVTQRQLKIGTGHLSQLHHQQGIWVLDYWNQAPAKLTQSVV